MYTMNMWLQLYIIVWQTNKYIKHKPSQRFNAVVCLFTFPILSLTFLTSLMDLRKKAVEGIEGGLDTDDTNGEVAFL